MSTKNKIHLLNSIILSVLLWLTVYGSAFSQSYLFDIQVINVEDGLPHRRVYDITQDNEGFIWVSTPGAISRYDGYTFKTYTRDVLDIREGSSPHIASDDQNRVWYATITIRGIYDNGGVMNAQSDSIYDLSVCSEGRFAAKDIVALHNFKDSGNAICIATRQGIVYRYEKSNFEEIYRFPGPISPPLHCEMDGDGGYWIAHDKEIIKIRNKKRLKTISINDSFLHVKRIVTTTPKLIIALDDFHSKTYWTLKDHNFVHLSTLEQAPDTIKKLIQHHKDYTIYTSGYPLLIRDHQGKLLYRFNDFEPSSPNTSLKINKTFSDQQDILWVATENGLFKIHAKENPFHILQAGNSIRGIYREGNKLWTGGYYGNRLRHLEEGITENYTSGRETVMSFHKDSNGHIWMGTNTHMLLEYSPKTERYLVHNFTKNAAFRLVFQNQVTGNYWLGTDKGVFQLYKKDSTVTPFHLPIPSKDILVRQFYQNKEGIWIITNKGLFLLDAQKENLIKHYTRKDGFPVINFNHMYEDAQGMFWLGTKGGGLLRWERTSNTIIQYTRSNGLSDNTVYAVYEDDNQTLWLPGNNGLMAFDKITQTTKVYLPKNGIAHEEFNNFAHFKDNDGTLYFGGLNGITRFQPRAFHGKTGNSPPLYATRIQVLEEDAEQYTDKTRDFFSAKKLRLQPDDQVLEVELTLLDYEKSAQNQYAYKFSGQQQWIYTNNNTLSIINLPFGRYDLIIKARGASGNWSEKTLSIPIHRPPPFYRRWWFLLSMAIAAIASVISIVKQRERRLRQDRKRLEAEVTKRTHQIEKDKQVIEAQAKSLKVLDEAKTRFFTNITHEFRTPLTLVTGPIAQLIADQPPPPVKKKLSGVLKNAHNLMELINQLLDVSKLESKTMKVEVFHGDLAKHTKELLSRFEDLTHTRQQQLRFTATPDSWKTYFDKDKWHKIINNLIFNAIKFTPKGGIINVNLQQLREEETEYIKLRVEDTGVGIAAKSLEHIFDRFYQADDSATRKVGGTGIGLALVRELIILQNGIIDVESTPGKGSIFTVQLPVLPVSEAANRLPESITMSDVLPAPVLAETEIGNDDEEHLDRDSSREKLELLIVEDHPEMRAYIRSCIDASVYTISEATNGEEGIAKAREIVPDLIISDVMMPKKDGFELTHAIRNHLATSHIPLILLTAKAALESRLKGLERGADAYLTKPFSPQELALRVQKLIELRRLLQQRYQGNNFNDTEIIGFQKEDTFVTDLNTYIEKNITEPDELDVQHISRHFGISRSQFYRKFKALTNVAIGNYIRNFRLEKALKLMKEEQLNITEAAYAIGFSSASSFSRAFKKTYGKSPSEYM